MHFQILHNKQCFGAELFWMGGVGGAGVRLEPECSVYSTLTID